MLQPNDQARLTNERSFRFRDSSLIHILSILQPFTSANFHGEEERYTLPEQPRSRCENALSLLRATQLVPSFSPVSLRLLSRSQMLLAQVVTPAPSPAVPAS